MPPKAKTSQADLNLLMQLMRIPGKSGEETEVAEFIIEHLVEAGADLRWIVQDRAHRSTPINGRCGNLILKIPGMRQPRRLLVSHMDSVSIFRLVVAP